MRLKARNLGRRERFQLTRADPQKLAEAAAYLERFVRKERATKMVLGQRDRLWRLCQFANSVEDKLHLRYAVAIVLTEARDHWDTADPVWPGVVRIVYPELDQRRRTELGKNLSLVAGLSLASAMKLVDSYGGVDRVGHMGLANLKKAIEGRNAISAT